jgi:hypothetical protein
VGDAERLADRGRVDALLPELDEAGFVGGGHKIRSFRFMVPMQTSLAFTRADQDLRVSSDSGLPMPRLDARGVRPP